MIKKASLLALIAGYFLLIFGTGSVQARSELAILDNSAQVKFPSELNFNLSVDNDINIADIRLYYVLDRISFTEVTSEVYIEFAPATTVDAQWTWNMRKTGGLPPGSNIRYWWAVEDANGQKVETEPIQIQFDDNRYSWQHLTEGRVTIYWYEGDNSFAQELMTAAQQALARLANDTGAELKKPVRLYVYATTQDLQGAMIYPQEWTGGIAFTRYGAIAIGIAPDDRQW
ncbi:peptidase MA family metallohydrolase, partial [Chloroflexota bacterium]